MPSSSTTCLLKYTYVKHKCLSLCCPHRIYFLPKVIYSIFGRKVSTAQLDADFLEAVKWCEAIKVILLLLHLSRGTNCSCWEILTFFFKKCETCRRNSACCFLLGFFSALTFKILLWTITFWNSLVWCLLTSHVPSGRTKSWLLWLFPNPGENKKVMEWEYSVPPPKQDCSSWVHF